MNNLFTSSSTSFLLIMLIIFGISALIKFAVRLFEMLIKLAFVLIVIFFGLKALEFSDQSPNHPNDQPEHTPPVDTISTDSLLLIRNTTLRKPLLRNKP